MELQARDDIVFCFVGGGSELCKVRSYARAQQLENIYCLPYQPQAKLAGLLLATDLHIVVMNDTDECIARRYDVKVRCRQQSSQFVRWLIWLIVNFFPLVC